MDDEANHMECVNSQCVCVEGSGADECESAQDCVCLDQEHHLECIYGMCECVVGAGINECSFIDQVCVVNDAPSADNLQALEGSYCTGIAGTGMAIFRWRYIDASGDREMRFQIQIDDDSSFASPSVDRIYENLSMNSGSTNEQIVFVKPDPVDDYCDVYGLPSSLCDHIAYGETYYWRVKVWDSNGGASAWINGVRYGFPKTHPAPNPQFDILGYDSTNPPRPGDTVVFRDHTSFCWNADGDPFACKTLTSSQCTAASDENGDGRRDCYVWDFGDGTFGYGLSAEGTRSHVYQNAGTYVATLRICDETGCCINSVNLNVKTNKGDSGLPDWREISPF
ncbi:MAG TPA: PKD domain-containing protein [Smithellaceae bacterium]|nr:PKD domain-containing protein [Smithellaceae bacterium]